MKTSKKLRTIKTAFAAAAVALGLSIFSVAKADSRPVADISEWQGYITLSQAKKMKQEFRGVILRVQYGEDYRDKVFAHNEAVLRQAGMKYGVYAFGQYRNAPDAASEARALYRRAPHALFYVNDAEQYTTYSGTFAAATQRWGSTMKGLTNKPVVIYSYRSFFQTYIKTTKPYDNFWLAAYQSVKPTPYNYGLWQYRDNYYSQSLGRSIDASKVITSTFGGYFDNSGVNNGNQYTAGGRIVGEAVRASEKAKFYPDGHAIDTATANTLLTIKQVKSVNVGKSNQAALLYNGDQVVGWVPSQYLTAYYHSPKVKKLKVTAAGGIYTYVDGVKANHYPKGSVIKVGEFFKYNEVYKARHFGHSKSYITANKNYVKWVK